jgi:2-polyprenyl-3-methyl-5-hydroxy-6-metoxy-1,4-benzoquinol methylase
MDKDLIESKWDKIYEISSGSSVADVLLSNDFLLPEKGVAIDLACGLGENALFLAKKGLETSAWDISSVALGKLKQNAKKNNLTISVKHVHIEPNNLPKNAFDVIVLSHFLDRSLCNAIIDGLKPKGLLFYQTYVREKLGSSGPKNPEFLLARNELLQLFNPLTVLLYREDSLVGDLGCGERNEAFFIGQKC